MLQSFSAETLHATIRWLINRVMKLHTFPIMYYNYEIRRRKCTMSCKHKRFHYRPIRTYLCMLAVSILSNRNANHFHKKAHAFVNNNCWLFLVSLILILSFFRYSTSVWDSIIFSDTLHQCGTHLFFNWTKLFHAFSNIFSVIDSLY